jgi:hypothetical protein
MKRRSQEIGSAIDPVSFGMDPATIAAVVYYAVKIAILCWNEYDARGKPDPHEAFLEFAKHHPRLCRIRMARAARRSNDSLNSKQSFMLADELIRKAKESSKEEFLEIYEESKNASVDDVGRFNWFGAG